MYIARLICSDQRCAEEVVAEAPTLEELRTLACDCGCGLEVIGWPDRVDDLVLVRPERRSPPADLAAA